MRRLLVCLCGISALLPLAGARAQGALGRSEATRLYGIEVDRQADRDQLLVFAEKPLEARLDEVAPDRARLRLPTAVLDPSAPRRVRPGGSGPVISVEATPSATGRGVDLVIQRAPGPSGRLSRRGAMLAVEFRPAADAPPARVTMQYDRRDLAEVTREVAAATGQAFVFDEQLRGPVTIAVAAPVPRDEALAILEAALLMKGFVAVPTPGGVRKILRLNDLPASAPWIPAAVLAGGETPVVTQVRIRAADVDELAVALKPFFGQGGLVLPYRPTDSLILATTERRLQRALRVVAALDHAATRDLLVRKLHYRPVNEALALLEEIVDRPDPLGAPVELWSDERTQTLLARSSPDRLNEIRALIDGLDVPAEGRGQIRVLPILHADAEQLAQTLQALAGGAPPPGAAPQTAAAASGLAGRAFSVTVHPATRALVVSADPETHALLRDLVRELDRPLPQIHVEATVLEVTTTGALALGFDAFVPVTDPKEPSDLIAVVASNPSGHLTSTPSPDQTVAAAAAFTRTPLTFPILGPGGDPVDVVVPRDTYILTADESEVRTQVLVRPHILALPGEEHEIFAGNNIPIPVSSTPGQAGASSSLSLNQNVERQDVGVRLRVQPFAWEGGEVRLELRLEESRVAPSVAGSVEEVGVTLERRELDAVARLRPGEFAVVGSLTRPLYETVRTGTPFLSEIPILGWFFRAERRREVHQQLVIAVQAWVQRSPEEDQAESIRRRIAFERNLARIEGLVERGAAPYAILVTTRPSLAEAEEVVRALTPPPGSGIQIVSWRSSGGQDRYDVYLTRFDRLAHAARAALGLNDAGWSAEVVALPPGRSTPAASGAPGAGAARRAGGRRAGGAWAARPGPPAGGPRGPPPPGGGPGRRARLALRGDRTAADTVVRHPQCRKPEGIQPPGTGLQPVEEAHRGRGSRDQTVRRDHGHAREALHGPTRPRIQEMPVSPPVHLHPALVVPAGGEPAGRQRDPRDRALGPSRIADPYPPRRSIQHRPHHRQIPAEVHETMTDPLGATEPGQTIGRVLLHVAAEVELHPGEREHQAWPVPDDPLPAHAVEQPLHLGGVRESPAPEVPRAP